MASRTYESAGMIMSIGAMTALANIFNSLKGRPQPTGKQDKKQLVRDLDQLSIN